MASQHKREESKGDEIDLDFERDPYLIELHKRYMEMKQERKAAEDQTTSLKNRLNLLKREEQKSQKQVECARAKYSKKISQMQTIEKDLKYKIEMKELQERELEKQREFNSKMKEEINSKIREKRDQKIKELVSETMKLREQKKQNDDLLKYIKMEETNSNRNKYDFIKNQKILFEEKKRALAVRGLT